MPRRNESGSGRRGPARAGGGRSFSGKGQTSGKPFKKRDSDDSKSPSRRKSFTGKRDSAPNPKAGTTRGRGRPSASSYKRGDEHSPKSDAGRNFGKGRNFSGDKSADRKGGFEKPFKRATGFSENSSSKTFSKKSRFAKPESKTFRAGGSGSAERKGFGKKTSSHDFDPAKSRGGNSERPFRKSFQGGAPARDSSGSKKKFSGGERRNTRSDSFGKPYKKIYKSKGHDTPGGAPIPEGASETRIPRKRIGAEEPATPKSNQIRLNKFIANSGVSSRREADELIKMNLISVNGKIVSELGYKINPGDEVRYESKVLHAEKPVYILMNKPKGFLTTTEDPQERNTVMHIVGSSVKERIYPVGRLDRNTTGLLLLTNDGELAEKLMHPSYNIKKIYKVELDRPLTKNDFQSIVDGVRLEEGRAIVDDLAIVSDDGRTIGVELHIGWNRVVRRIFESLDYQVIKLDRTIYADLDKKELSRGQWRFLTKEEIIHLKHFK